MPPSPEDSLAEIREAIGRLFARMREFEARLARLEPGEGAEAAAPPEEEQPPVRAEVVERESEEEASEELTETVEISPEEAGGIQEVEMPAEPVAKAQPPRPLSPAERHELETSLRTREVFSATAAKQPPPSQQPTPLDRLQTKLREKFSDFSWEELIGAKGAMWAGAIVIILAIAYGIQWVFTKYDLPYVKSGCFHAMGLAFLGAGYYLRIKKHAALLGEALTGLGIFTLYAVAFAGRQWFDPPLFGEYNATVTFLEACAITLAAVVIAVRIPSVVVVLLGALGGYATPFVIGGDPPNHVLLFSYLAFLNTTLIASAVLRKWSFLKPLTFAALAGVFFLWLHNDYFLLNRANLRWSTEWLVVLHAAIFLLGSTIPPVVWKRKSNQFDLAALSASSLWLMGMTWYIFRDYPHQQLALVSWGLALLHLGLFWLTYSRVTNVDRMPRIHLALSAIFFTLAVPLQLNDASYLPLAWAFEGLIFAAVGIWFRDRQMYVSSYIVFALATGYLLGWIMPQEASYFAGTAVSRQCVIFCCSGFLALLTGCAYLWMPRAAQREADSLERTSASVLLMGGNVALMLGILLQWRDSRMVLALWTFDIAIVWAIGFGFRSRITRTYALLLAVVFLIHRFLLHGIADPPEYRLLLNARFGTFAFAGLMLAVFGWLYSRLQAAPPGQSKPQEASIEEQQLHVPLGIVAHLLLLGAIFCEINSHSLLTWGDVPLRDTYLLLTFSVASALYGAALLAVGFALNYRLYRDMAMVLGAVVLLKVSLIDHFQQTYRVAGGQLDIRFVTGEFCAVLIGLAAASYSLPAIVRRCKLEASERQAAIGVLGLANIAAMFALSCQLEGRVVLIVWTLYLAGLWAIGFARDWLGLRWYAAVLALVMVGGRVLYEGIAYEEPYRLLLNSRFVSLALVGMLYLAAGWCYRRLWLAAQEDKGDRLKRIDKLAEQGMNRGNARLLLELEDYLDPLLGVLGNAVMLVALSLEVHTWFAVADAAGRTPFPDMDMAQQASYSILWAVYAAGMVVAGFLLRYPLFRYLGLSAFVPILAKVFLIDLAWLETLPRVLALAVLGVMLLGVAFLYQQFAARILDEPRRDQAENSPPPEE